MKIIDNRNGENDWHRRPNTEIFPFINQDDSIIIDDPDDMWHGEEMGCIRVYLDGTVEIDYGWEEPPHWPVEMAEQYALAMTKAVEIAKQYIATPHCARCGQPISDDHERIYGLVTGTQFHVNCALAKASGS